MRVHSPASVGARRSPTNAFSSVDLPALTRPAIATRRGPASRSRIDAIWLAYADPAVREASESTSASTWSAADPNPEAVTTVVMPSTPDLLLDRRERGERLGALGGARLAFLLRALHVGLGALRAQRAQADVQRSQQERQARAAEGAKALAALAAIEKQVGG